MILATWETGRRLASLRPALALRSHLTTKLKRPGDIALWYSTCLALGLIPRTGGKHWYEVLSPEKGRSADSLYPKKMVT